MKNTTKPFAWIETEPAPQDREKLEATYQRLGLPPNGDGLDHVLKVHAAMPETLDEHLAFYQGIMRRPGPLSRIECEIIGVAVSNRNGCHY